MSFGSGHVSSLPPLILYLSIQRPWLYLIEERHNWLTSASRGLSLNITSIMA